MKLVVALEHWRHQDMVLHTHVELAELAWCRALCSMLGCIHCSNSFRRCKLPIHNAAPPCSMSIGCHSTSLHSAHVWRSTRVGYVSARTLDKRCPSSWFAKCKSARDRKILSGLLREIYFTLGSMSAAPCPPADRSDGVSRSPLKHK